jgi:type II secretory pathway pseudopilin PulG
MCFFEPDRKADRGAIEGNRHMNRAKLLVMSILATTALFGVTASQAALQVASQANRVGPRAQLAADQSSQDDIASWTLAENEKSEAPLLLQGSDPDEPGGDTDYDTDQVGSSASRDRNEQSSAEDHSGHDSGRSADDSDD